jgi:hypothetical protein
MATNKRKLNEINGDKKQRSSLLLFKPNVEKITCADENILDSNNDEHKIPKFSIKRTVNRDSNLSEFKIKTKTEDSEGEEEEDDENDDETNENMEDDEENEDLSLDEEIDDENEKSEESIDSNEESSVGSSVNREISHSIELIQSKQNLLKLKLKNLAGNPDTITTTSTTESSSTPKRSLPVKTREPENEDDRSIFLKMKGKRGRKPGYRKYAEGDLKQKLSSKTPRSITSYFLFCQVNRLKIAEKNPELKLRAIQRILSEQWNKLTDKERLIWRQKAVKLGKKGSKGMISTGVTPQVQQKPLKKINLESTIKPIENPSNFVDNPETAPLVQERKKVKMLSLPQNLINFVEDCKPIDLAAHLSLIGESMTQFGNKILKSQEVFTFIKFLKISLIDFIRRLKH